MSAETRNYVTSLAWELTTVVSVPLGDALTAAQAVGLYCRFHTAIGDLLGDWLDDLAVCGELGERK
jgi:hypothetical protein